MSEQWGVFIGECGHLVPIEASGRLIPCACDRDRPTASSRRRDYLAQLRAAVEDLARSRYLLSEVIELADEIEADTITNEMLRHRLTVLADRARDGSTSPTDPRPATG